MTFAHDIKVIDRLIARDPSFRSVSPDALNQARAELEQATRRTGFILAAMRLAALPGNGHTRIIPNAACECVPARVVAIGETVALTDADLPGWRPGELKAVNGVAIETILERAKPFLAGPASRRRAIAAILASWPAALERLGVPPGTPTYRLTDRDGASFELVADDRRVPGDIYYPTSETGHLSASSREPHASANTHGSAWHIRLRSFFCEDDALDRSLAEVADTVLSDRNRPLIVDLRGNTGGSFLKALPLLDALAENRRGRSVALLVDKFTFSAAIVFAALVRARLPGPVPLIGEDMGDRAAFWAEGGTERLPDTGAAFRYSTAYHDWRTGIPDATTPPEIARHLVAAGPLRTDIRVGRSLWDILDGRDPPLDAAVTHFASNG